jgi:hypothetical protein
MLKENHIGLFFLNCYLRNVEIILMNVMADYFVRKADYAHRKAKIY